MAHNSKLRSVARCESGFQHENRSPVRRTQTDTRLLWGGREVRREPARINENITQKETRCFLRVAVAFLGLAMAVSGGVLASIHIEPEKSYFNRSTAEGEVLVSSMSEAVSRYVRTVAPIDSQNRVAQLSLRPGFSFDDSVQSLDSKQSTPIPTHSEQLTSATHPYPAESAFVPKGELAHEYWRAIGGPSKIIERYESYLRAHPSGILADTAIERITDLSRGPD